MNKTGSCLTYQSVRSKSLSSLSLSLSLSLSVGGSGAGVQSTHSVKALKVAGVGVAWLSPRVSTVFKATLADATIVAPWALFAPLRTREGGRLSEQPKHPPDKNSANTKRGPWPR